MASTDSVFKLEFPYKRSLGPMVSAFLTGLRDCRLVGVRTAAGKVLVPPLEYDPDTGDPTGAVVEVADPGVIEEWAWVREPLRTHPLDRPFAWVLVRPDGADTTMLHVLDADSPEAVQRGMRVRARWRAERRGHITDLECFEADGSDGPDASDGAEEGGSATTEPVTTMEQKIDLEYRTPVNPLQQRFEERLAAGVITGQRCADCGKVYVPPKGFCPICSVLTPDEVAVADHGIVTSYTVVVPIQYPGQTETEEYVLASILVEGADSTLGQQRIEGIAHDEVRMGMRVRAQWREHAAAGDATGRLGLGAAIAHWVPTGEPDLSREAFAEHVF